MGSRATEAGSPPAADSTPEDVAALYSWANLQGAKYRDYSASRREYRAQVRYRVAKAQLEKELKAQEEAEASAAEAESIALAAQSLTAESPTARLLSVRRAEAAARKAAADRVEAARRAEAAAHAAVLALREEREISEAHSSEQRKAQLYEEAELRRRRLAGPQPRVSRDNALASPQNLSPSLSPEESFSENELPEAHTPAPASTERETHLAASGFGLSDLLADWIDPQKLPNIGAAAAVPEAELHPTVPAWLHNAQSPPPPAEPMPSNAPFAHLSAAAETLLDSRERVASRWSALNAVFEHPAPELPSLQLLLPGHTQTQILAVFSLAGGVGKTSLAAALGRALASQGEDVVLADATSHGLLPIYFSARETPHAAVSAEPSHLKADGIPLVACDLAAAESEHHRQTLVQEILHSAQGHQRLLLDLPSGSSWLLRRLADLRPTVLVPMAPDMNSVISLAAIERLFHGIADSAGRPIQPIYVLNQFDVALPLHLDVREALSRQLSHRLLRTVIRRSPAVSEALAEGMTVLDYAPDAPVSHDYLDLASWVSGASPPLAPEVRNGLRGEQ